MKNFLKILLFDSKQCHINKVIWRLRIIMRGFFKNSVLFYCVISKYYDVLLMSFSEEIIILA